MAKRKRRSIRSRFSRKHRGAKDRRFPLLVGIPAINQALVQPGMEAFKRAQAGDFPGAVTAFGNNLANNFAFCDISTGTPIFNSNAINRSIGTYTMLIAGFIGSKAATAMGVNKVMKRMPIVGKYIKL